MPPVNSQFGGGATETMLHPVVAIAMLVAITLMFLLPKKYVVVPFLLAVFLTPAGQELYVGGLHIFVLRILILTGWVRALRTKYSSGTRLIAGGVNSIDKYFVLWACFRVSAVLFLFRASSAPVVNQLGFIWDTLGGYFLLRFLIHDQRDIGRVVKTFAAITSVLAVTMLNEKLRGHNVFGLLGGVPEVSIVREGSIRAQGTFEVCILAGVFAATLMPLFVWLWKNNVAKRAAVAGAVGSTLMVVTSASSTPLLAYLAVIFGICCWPLRKRMRMVRWSLLAMLLVLHITMKAPVWFLIDHVDLVAGNSGYHRAELIDQFVKHFSAWWLIGVKSTMDWGWDMWDLSNQFIAEGEVGGLATLVCFIMLISRAFGRIGRARLRAGRDQHRQWFLWLLGVALFANIVAFFGISYFDQTRIAWYALFAIISAATMHNQQSAGTSILKPAPDVLSEWSAQQWT